MPKAASLILLVSCVTAVAACGGTSEPATVEPCTGAVTPSVSGTRFSWTPRCGLSDIVVLPPPSNNGPQVAWEVKAEAKLLAPGIDYGVMPNGAATVIGPYPLQTGLGYHVAFEAPGFVHAGDLAWTP